jgi:hypothetical protein
VDLALGPVEAGTGTTGLAQPGAQGWEARLPAEVSGHRAALLLPAGGGGSVTHEPQYGRAWGGTGGEILATQACKTQPGFMEPCYVPGSGLGGHGP